MAKHPEVLIEKWFPVGTIGAESMRERGASSALPPLYFLHVWWARRPLAASRAAILASVLPVWSKDWPKALLQQFPTEASYHQWFVRLCGIFGDPVQGRKLVDWAKDRGIKLKVSPYQHKRAFTVSPSPEYLDTLGALLQQTWGTKTISVLDPFSGGGSIPFEARRYQFATCANELNPVASVLLRATLDYPFQFGPKLAADIRETGKLLADRVRRRLERFYPVEPGEPVHAMIWARTVACPHTGKPIPLVPNWWLQKGAAPVAIRPVFAPSLASARFEIIKGTALDSFDAESGTIKRGNAVSPWATNQPVDGDYIKAEAQAGRMGRVLYAVAVKPNSGITYRVPTDADHQANLDAEAHLRQLEVKWGALDVLPNENIDSVSNYDRGHRLYGMNHWRDIYLPRQLLALGMIVEELRQLRMESSAGTQERNIARTVYEALILDGCAARNSLMSVWVPLRQVVAPAFVQHNFSIKWTFAEFDAARNLLPWVVEQVAEAYERIAGLAAPSNTLGRTAEQAPLTITAGSATNLSIYASGSIQHICTDPPYYDNVMYAELSDYFYVWMKRLLAGTFSELFESTLTPKDEEAVANVARFASSRKGKRELARSDYQRKMAAAFREMHRVLTIDGVLTVMFTHKQTEAWDTLATSLIGAGFDIRSSWPVRTEYEKGLHLAKKSGAQSTIFLSCRKRDPRAEPVWWEDLKARIRQTARQTALKFESEGIRGVDLYISTFGPVLSILSENWPVLTSEIDDKGNPKPLRPEVALDLARAEVVTLRKQNLLLGHSVQFDKVTDWYLMAWDAFGASEFPADEARKLALALDLDLERDVVGAKRLVKKKQATVVLNAPAARRKRDMVDSEKKVFDCWIDAAHTAMLLYNEDGAATAEQFLRSAGIRFDATFKALVQALLNAIPRTRIKGKFARPEAEVLEAMRLAFFDDLQVPSEEEPRIEATQLTLGIPAANDDSNLDEEDEDEDDDEDADEDAEGME